MHVWILEKKEWAHSYASNRLKETAKRLGIRLKIVDPIDCEIVTSREATGSIFIKKKKVDALPDCIIPKMGAGTTTFATAVLRHLERRGVYTLNNCESIRTAKDKLATIQILAGHNIPIPRTILAKLPLDLALIKKEIGFPLLVKKVSASFGKGIVLCTKQRELEDIADVLDPNQDFIIQ